MTLPRVLIASPIRYRPDYPEVLPAFLDALAGLDWPEERREFYFVVQQDRRPCPVLQALSDMPGEHSGQVVQMQAPEDSRHLGGPRSTGATTMRLAFLRNLVLERFAESGADLLLMVDSDVILAPGAVRRMVETLRERVAEFGCRANRHEKRERLTFYATLRATCTLQLDNRAAEDHAPASNGQAPTAAGMMPAPYATDGSVIEVARAGACTLYPRSVLARRFRWDPRYNEEHQAFFDDLRELGFRHYLIRDPALADHRMTRDRPL